MLNELKIHRFFLSHLRWLIMHSNEPVTTFWFFHFNIAKLERSVGHNYPHLYILHIL